jgi:hypothetical protein
MPFTLAHPAAVLPLRRYCPRLLSFPALIMGSMSPDVGYCFGRLNADRLSHQWIEGLGFCLPVGLLMLGFLYYLRSPVVRLLPERYQEAFLPLCRRPLGSLFIVVISLVIGVWSHLLWDSFTHNDGWFVEHLALLQSPVASVAGRTVRVCHLLWYGFSFAGIVWLFLVYEKWKQTAGGGALGGSGTKLRDAIVLAVVVLPIEVMHHLMRSRLGLYLVAGFSLLVVISGVVLGIMRTGRSGRMSRERAVGVQQEETEITEK